MRMDDRGQKIEPCAGERLFSVSILELLSSSVVIRQHKGATPMPDRTPFLDWRRNLLASVGLALLLLVLFYLLATHGVQSAQAQGTLSLAIDKTLQGSNVVRVGQYLTFTIRIANTGTISIAQLPLFDNYEAQ